MATDVEELTQGAALEVEYTYVLKNESEQDYLSDTLVKAYEDQSIKTYAETLKEINNTIRSKMRNGAYAYRDNNIIGTYLGQYYYTGDNTGCVPVSSTIETLEEALNNTLQFETEISGTDFIKNNNEQTDKTIYGIEGNPRTEKINTVVKSTKGTAFLTKGAVDYSRKIKLTTILTSVTGGELGANIPSYIAEITTYTNAAGRRDMNSVPANLRYVHSYDTTMTMGNSNEPDEFWGESIIITKPTGEDKITPMQIIITTISALAVLGVGIILIKKIALKK